jgi:hypothetical protein
MNNVQTTVACVVLVVALTSCTPIHESLRSFGPVARDIMASHLAGDPRVHYEGTWKYAHSAEVKGEYAINEYVPKGETIENWTRLYTDQNMRRSGSFPAGPEGHDD